MLPSEILDLALDSPDLLQKLGTPVRTSQTQHFRVYDFDQIEDREYAWSLVTDSNTGAPLCVTRRFVLPQNFEPVFPAADTRIHSRRGALASVRKLDATRILIGIGRHQLVLIRDAALPRFFPWLQDPGSPNPLAA